MIAQPRPERTCQTPPGGDRRTHRRGGAPRKWQDDPRPRARARPRHTSDLERHDQRSTLRRSRGRRSRMVAAPGTCFSQGHVCIGEPLAGSHARISFLARGGRARAARTRSSTDSDPLHMPDRAGRGSLPCPGTQSRAPSGSSIRLPGRAAHRIMALRGPTSARARMPARRGRHLTTGKHPRGRRTGKGRMDEGGLRSRSRLM
jgi:hypothetical protein